MRSGTVKAETPRCSFVKNGSTLGGCCTYPPAHLGVAVADEAQAKLEPVGDDDAEDVQRELGRDKGSAGRVGGHFCAPDGDDRVQVASADTVDDARATHPAVHKSATDALRGHAGIAVEHTMPRSGQSIAMPHRIAPICFPGIKVSL